MNKFYVLYTEWEHEGYSEPEIFYSIEDLLDRGYAYTQMCDVVYVKIVDTKTNRSTKHFLNRGYTGVSRIKWEKFINEKIK